MASEQQETKNLPRNRKCGNCRFFEPAPLWRKGWCRNSQLYPPHANHLVDSTSIDCEGGFRSRIYWEPLPVAATSGQASASVGTVPVTPRVYRSGSEAADSGQEARANETFLAAPQYENQPSPEVADAEFFQVEPAVAKVEQVATETTNIPNPPGFDWRAALRQRASFTRTWPLEKINPAQVLPWALAGFLALIVLFTVFGGNKDKEKASIDSIRASAVATQNAQLVGSSATITTTNGATVRTGSTTPGPATTLTSTASALKGKAATISGLGGDVLRLRAQPNVTSEVLDRLKDGDKVQIVEGPVDADKLEWYKVEVNGKTGWLVKKYVTLI